MEKQVNLSKVIECLRNNKERGLIKSVKVGQSEWDPGVVFSARSGQKIISIDGTEWQPERNLRIIVKNPSTLVVMDENNRVNPFLPVELKGAFCFPSVVKKILIERDPKNLKYKAVPFEYKFEKALIAVLRKKNTKETTVNLILLEGPRMIWKKNFAIKRSKNPLNTVITYGKKFNAKALLIEAVSMRLSVPRLTKEDIWKNFKFYTRIETQSPISLIEELQKESGDKLIYELAFLPYS